MKKPAEINVKAGEAIAALKAGQRDIIEELYDLHRASFLGWASKRFYSTPADIEDAWQEAIAVFYDLVMSGRLNRLTCSVKTFLFAVAHKWLLKNDRKLKRIWWKDEMDGVLATDPQLAVFTFDDLWEEERLLLRAAMDKLSPQCKELLTQRHYHEQTIAELMAHYDYASVNAVSATLSTCLAKLKSFIQEKTKK